MKKTYLRRSDELYHFGILGQKWGIRRYENEDGTLTEEGKNRYRNKLEKKYNKDSKKINKYIKSDEYKKIQQKNIESSKKSAESYEKERNYFYKGEKYKGLDYYQFKEKSAYDWYSSKEGKEDLKNQKELNQYLKSKVKDFLKDKYDTPLKEFDYSNRKTLGEYYTDNLIRNEKFKINKLLDDYIRSR